MKRLFLLLLVSVFIISGCAFDFNIKPEKDYNSIYATDVNGTLVPFHENVSESRLDAKQYFFDENGRAGYNNPDIDLLHGIDVSVFQGDIDWEAVKSDGIDFVMLRIGFRGYGSKGIIQLDNKFDENYTDAVAAGLKVGVYFYSQALTSEEAIEEAAFVVSALENRSLDFPVVFDWEYVDNAEARTKDMTSEQITQCAISFCKTIKDNGYLPMIYFNREIGYFEYNLALVDEFDFWLAEYSSYPTFIYEYTMWQYTDSGTVNGIDGRVDLNVSLVDYSQFYDAYG